MPLDLSRRSLIRGLGALIAAPAIVRVASIMPVKAFRFDTEQRFEQRFSAKFKGLDGGPLANIFTQASYDGRTWFDATDPMGRYPFWRACVEWRPLPVVPFVQAFRVTLPDDFKVSSHAA